MWKFLIQPDRGVCLEVFLVHSIVLFSEIPIVLFIPADFFEIEYATERNTLDVKLG